MRVCILAQADAFVWTAHYVRAFRRYCEVFTVGPAMSSGVAAQWKLGDKAARIVPNDVTLDLTEDVILSAQLPEGWIPDLIVAISNAGMPLRPQFEAYRCPKVYLSIDTWQSPGDYLDAQLYDFVFVAQRQYVETFRAVGCAHVYWLPLACDPAFHCPAEAPEDKDIVFVGSIALPVHQERYELIQALEKKWDVLRVTNLWGQEQCYAYCRGKLVFNHSAVFDLNMRIFEAPAMGRALLTNEATAKNGLLDLFEDGKHLIVYRDKDDLVEKVAYYLSHDEERKAVAEAGRREVLRAHTYDRRVGTLVKTVAEHVPDFVRPELRVHTLHANPFASLTPCAPGIVLDIGLVMTSTYEELRQRGAKTILGMAAAPWEGPLPSGYAAVLRSLDDANLPDAVNTVVLANAGLVHEQPIEALRAIAEKLAPGGTLIACLWAHDLASMGLAADGSGIPGALLSLRMHVTRVNLMQSPDGAISGALVTARKSTRRLYDVVDETVRALSFDASGLLDIVRSSVGIAY